MSYDIKLCDPVTGNTLHADSPHHMRGGTYCLGGTTELWINITYNYSPHFWRVMGENGIRSLYGKTGAEVIPLLEEAIVQLGDDVDPDYWKPTEGNAKQALCALKAMAQSRPDGVFQGD
jgi:hypothetical protein